MYQLDLEYRRTRTKSGTAVAKLYFDKQLVARVDQPLRYCTPETTLWIALMIGLNKAIQMGVAEIVVVVPSIAVYYKLLYKHEAGSELISSLRHLSSYFTSRLSCGYILGTVT